MGVYTGKIILEDRGGYEVFNITEKVKAEVEKSGLKKGIVNIFVPGATGALTTIEYEPGLIQDLKELLDRYIPPGRNYHHEKRWHDGNGHSHLRASLVGPSISIPFVNKTLTLGTWQQIIFLEFDNKPHRRELVVQVVGE
ncbi:YjbQ family protein [Candidatus Aerophobetes bacterium]|uniref:YjbQ family protein n=1 Tax=Aerophobetes bacterium TaxID=2030807 RepID=A0A662DFT7_UNCAE|nr:MAG: YjbQ family protein [Candidatus Aerophobetes bacterium]